MSNRKRARNEPEAKPRMSFTLTADHKPSNDICMQDGCGRLIYKTARKPWRHLDTKSTYCNHDKRGILK